MLSPVQDRLASHQARSDGSNHRIQLFNHVSPRARNLQFHLDAEFQFQPCCHWGDLTDLICQVFDLGRPEFRTATRMPGLGEGVLTDALLVGMGSPAVSLRRPRPQCAKPGTSPGRTFLPRRPVAAASRVHPTGLPRGARTRAFCNANRAHARGQTSNTLLILVCKLMILNNHRSNPLPFPFWSQRRPRPTGPRRLVRVALAGG